MPNYILSADLGKTRDHTALIVLELHGEPPKLEYHARHIERLPTSTPYPRQVERIANLHQRLQGPAPPPPTARDEILRDLDLGHLATPPKRNTVQLIADQTGVGQAVVDMLRDANLPTQAVTITGGDNATRNRYNHHVPKRDLVSSLVVTVQTGRLKIAAGNPLARALVDELLGFRLAINARGHDTYGNDVGEWRQAAHDDLVLAIAIGVWYGETQTSRFEAFIV